MKQLLVIPRIALVLARIYVGGWLGAGLVELFPSFAAAVLVCADRSIGTCKATTLCIQRIVAALCIETVGDCQVAIPVAEAGAALSCRTCAG